MHDSQDIARIAGLEVEVVEIGQCHVEKHSRGEASSSGLVVADQFCKNGQATSHVDQRSQEGRQTMDEPPSAADTPDDSPLENPILLGILQRLDNRLSRESVPERVTA